MIKLKLTGKETLEQINSWKELKNVDLDAAFGIVCLSPLEGLFVVRSTIEITDEIYQQLAGSNNPKILGVFGDIRIGTTSESSNARQHQGNGSISGQPTDGNRSVNGDATWDSGDVDSGDE